MKRRHFIQQLSVTGAAIALAPELALSRPNSQSSIHNISPLSAQIRHGGLYIPTIHHDLRPVLGDWVYDIQRIPFFSGGYPTAEEACRECWTFIVKSENGLLPIHWWDLGADSTGTIQPGEQKNAVVAGDWMENGSPFGVCHQKLMQTVEIDTPEALLVVMNGKVALNGTKMDENCATLTKGKMRIEPLQKASQILILTPQN